MSRVDFDRVRTVFLAACELDVTARNDLLRRACGSNAALRDEVESLLVHHDAERVRPTTPMVGKAVASILTPPETNEPALPRAFGAFELLEVIGRGGMGTVYRAQQRTPDRTVALKVIRPGMMTNAMRERFRYEADVLARLQHPGIAQIFEAGAVVANGDEQPFFALELIDGQPIDAYASEHGLDARARIEMLVKACDAVHHAHQKGVIHRDLKPGNILVDGTGQPKVLDFGVARAIDADVRATTVRTTAGQLIGTLPYMSPEQVAGDPRRLDVRSDVYALGVLIFELLTGRLPYDLTDKTLAGAAVVIRDTPPLRLGSIAPSLRGDLETITAKTLEKDPARRYASAAALAEDLRRYLAHQPLIARPPSMTYQLRLFARRHRTLVTAGALSVVALVLATALSIGFALAAQRSADRATKQQRIAERTNHHLESMLRLPDPHRGGETPSVATMLDLLVERLDDEDELPEVEAAVRGAVGNTYLNLGRHAAAAAQLERATDLMRAIDPQDPELAKALGSLGFARIVVGDPDGSEAAYREAVAIAEPHGDPTLWGLRAHLLGMLIRRGKFDEAAPLARAQVASARERGDPTELAGMLRHAARTEFGLGRCEGAFAHLDEANAIAAQHLSETHPLRINLLLDKSMMWRTAGDPDGALAPSRAAFELTLRARTPGSPDWLTTARLHIELLETLGRRDEAIDALERSRAAMVTTHGTVHAFVVEADARIARLREDPPAPRAE